MSSNQAQGGHAVARRYPQGAEIVPGGVHFQVWAPIHNSISVVVDGGGEHGLARQDDGTFAGVVTGLAAGARYKFRLSGEDNLYPDLASRSQPDGPFGFSEVVDPAAFAWTDAGWRGIELEGQVIYEFHVGTFTQEGTWAAASERLPHLKEVGITCLEMMPVNDFPGRFGWGYDGVGIYAPTRLYGTPDDLRRFIDHAHGLGLGVILDVVYNHFGPSGNYFDRFSPDYFTKKYENEWGASINFDGDHAEGCRAFVAGNAAYWVDEYHFDGLRLDATQALFDNPDHHIMREITQAVHRAAGRRKAIVIGENEPQQVRLIGSLDSGGYGLDALWNDDFHHSATVAMTGSRQAYYHDHFGMPQEFISTAKYGYLYQGQRYDWQRDRRGTPGLDIQPCHFVSFIQNHDQIANSGRGRRIHQTASPGRVRAITAFMLLMAQTPMLFQGQEFGASAPFYYFADQGEDIDRQIRDGRRDFLAQFPGLADPVMADRLIDPAASATFEACKLDWREFDTHTEAVSLHRDLLRLRRDDRVFSAQPGLTGDARIDGSVIGPEAFLLRLFGHQGDDRLLLVNLGPDLVLTSIPDPLTAPPSGKSWHLQWSSEHPDYGGTGTPETESRGGWMIPAHAAIVLAAGPHRNERPAPATSNQEAKDFAAERSKAT